MGTLTVANIISNVRSDLNETTTTMLSDAEITIIINDGYKDVATKSMCYESKLSKTTAVGEKIISLASDNVIKINYVEYRNNDTDGGWGMLASIPQTIGYSPASLVSSTNGTGTPQYWFKWGNYLIIEPIPDVATYHINVYASCYPDAVRVATSADIAAGNVPIEFHECIYLFTMAYTSLKLKRWAEASIFYNKYIISVQQKRMEYVLKSPDQRASHELPDNVIMQEQKGG